MEKDEENVDRPKGMSAWSIKQLKIRAEYDKQKRLKDLEKAFHIKSEDADSKIKAEYDKHQQKMKGKKKKLENLEKAFDMEID